MTEHLRYYLALDSGLAVMQGRDGALETVAEFFPDAVIDDLVGSRTRPELVFAAALHHGAYRTRDAGRTWEQVFDGTVHAITVDPHDDNVVYLGTSPVRLYRSEDAGFTWDPLDGLLAVPAEAKKKWGAPAVLPGEIAHVRYIFVHPDDRNLLFVLLEHGGVLRSTDRGATWTDCTDGIAYVDMHMIGSEPGSTDRYYVTSARGFFRSDDRGDRWRRVESGMPWGGTEKYSYSHDLCLVAAGASRVVVGYGRGSPGVWQEEKSEIGGHIMLSEDAGTSWRAARGFDPHSMPWALARHPSDARTLYCGAGGYRGFVPYPTGARGALYRSRDAGETWVPMTGDMPAILEVWVAPD